MSLIRKHGAVLQAWACLALVHFAAMLVNLCWSFHSFCNWTWLLETSTSRNSAFTL